MGMCVRVGSGDSCGWKARHTRTLHDARQPQLVHPCLLDEGATQAHESCNKSLHTFTYSVQTKRMYVQHEGVTAHTADVSDWTKACLLA